jgi:N-acetylglucosamine kinase-like BadF-type ATPase
MSYFIGIDGGGSATRAIFTDASGKCLAVKNSGSSNFQHLSLSDFKSRIIFLLGELYKDSMVNKPDIRRITAGFAGVGRETDRVKAESVFEDLGFSDRITVTTDIDIAFAGAIPNGPGIVLNAGTGSFAYGRDDNGNYARSGGWGYLLGDEGSGYYIGLEAIKLCLKQYEAGSDKSDLMSIILLEFGLDDITQVIPRIYSEAINRQKIAEIAPIVLDAAMEGNSEARIIAEKAGHELSDLVRTILNRLSYTKKPVKLCLTGGVFEKHEAIVPVITDDLKDEVELTGPEFSPAVGAILIAMKDDDVVIDEDVFMNLRKISL